MDEEKVQALVAYVLAAAPRGVLQAHIVNRLYLIDVEWLCASRPRDPSERGGDPPSSPLVAAYAAVRERGTRVAKPCGTLHQCEVAVDRCCLRTTTASRLGGRTVAHSKRRHLAVRMPESDLPGPPSRNGS